MTVITYLVIVPTDWTRYGERRPTKAKVIKALASQPTDAQGVTVRLEIEVPPALLMPYMAQLQIDLPEPSGEVRVTNVDIVGEEPK